MPEIWLLAAAVALLVAMVWFGWFWKPSPDPDACPQCDHEAGLNGKHCEHVEDISGWVSDRCRCQNAYHWNYESTVVDID